MKQWSEKGIQVDGIKHRGALPHPNAARQLQSLPPMRSPQKTGAKSGDW